MVSIKALSVFLAATIVGVSAETHTVHFDNRCGRGTPTLIQGGNVLSTGGDFTINGPLFGAIAHSFSVTSGFGYFNGCDGSGADCTNGGCPMAFRNPNDNFAQVACQSNNYFRTTDSELFFFSFQLQVRLAATRVRLLPIVTRFTLNREPKPSTLLTRFIDDTHAMWDCHWTTKRIQTRHTFSLFHSQDLTSDVFPVSISWIYSPKHTNGQFSDHTRTIIGNL
ncbi:hypothetical protein GALMADRAFT_1351979 [Galerina marginata CBS 339.88]|uniref:Uncharacterized protein n=1 Tax=Galerina marginata (strain CBS 339.88) TaxID=685588 RepID=A0A067SG31_GALM3|nr:hypothetical protein GALMADRAFT_1351979 [Galerina marginata CBS 339.88]